MSHSDLPSKMSTFSKAALRFGKRLVLAAPAIPMWSVVYVGLFSVVLVATLKPKKES